MASKKIFISYSKKDTEYVSSLVQALRQQGFDVWFDKNIMTGNDWDDTIEEEIKNADALILILSKTSVASENVKDEMSYALSLGKSVNPIKIEECNVPMRLARKQFIDFAILGHDLGFERLVKDINLQLMDDDTVQVPKGTFVPPKQHTAPVFPTPKPKSNNNLVYIIGGIILGGIMVVAFIILLVAVFTPDSDNIDGGDYDSENAYQETQLNTTVEDQDWNSTYTKNNLDSYIAFLYHYGKTTKYYTDAYSEINKFLPKTAAVWYGSKGGDFNFSKHLYYAGDQTTPPQYEDIITPLFKSELYEGENYERNGLFVQPGQKLLVYDVWVDVNNNIWAGVRY
ncbi:TIR domain-containing protein [Gelidibacter algens]|uniref:TIR domain-containing protein n=1 Tax=Gelidibacter algens TaxID=49280 RepID=A0A1A7R2L4_9FLAO|nr:toll/interleukin-1 receptor domain-containing protein [Gelidibacter algens]OBX26505.1 hypothetical protein A9996_04205 [Gelidibacter algens]RAJ26672.1 TIR domain-containing protein [Gelidibacter algens]